MKPKHKSRILLVGMVLVALAAANLGVFFLAPEALRTYLFWADNLLIAAIGLAADLLGLFPPRARQVPPQDGTDDGLPPPAGSSIHQSAGDQAVQIGQVGRDVNIYPPSPSQGTPVPRSGEGRGGGGTCRTRKSPCVASWPMHATTCA